MNYVYIGEIVNTHGLKGEVRIISSFKQKDLVFVSDMPVYIGANKDKEIISSYRKHKNYDMITFVNIRHIEDVLKYKGKSLYINRADLKYDGYLNEDLIKMAVYQNNKLIGHVKEILTTNAHEILVIDGKKRYMVPNIEEFILNVDLDKKRIDIKYMKGLIDEN